MGHAVGAALRQHGVDVVGCVEGRGALTRELATRAGFRLLPDIDAVVEAADLLLSIVPPAAARSVAATVAQSLTRVTARAVFVDCNAIAPDSVRDLAGILEPHAIAFVDAGIVGPPPAVGTPTIYVSGPNVTPVLALDGMGFAVRTLGPEIGRASALKMHFSAFNKGSLALFAAVLMAAEEDDLLTELMAEIAGRRKPLAAIVEGALPGLAMNAQRWAPEMDEIVATYAGLGAQVEFHQGAAAIYRRLARSELAAETRDTRDPARTAADAIRSFNRAARAGNASLRRERE